MDFFRLFQLDFILYKFVIYVQGPRLRVGSGAYGTTGELARKINGGGGGGGGDEGKDGIQNGGGGIQLFS